MAGDITTTILLAVMLKILTFAPFAIAKILLFGALTFFASKIALLISTVLGIRSIMGSATFPPALPMFKMMSNHLMSDPGTMFSVNGMDNSPAKGIPAIIMSTADVPKTIPASMPFAEMPRTIINKKSSAPNKIVQENTHVASVSERTHHNGNYYNNISATKSQSDFSQMDNGLSKKIIRQDLDMNFNVAPQGFLHEMMNSIDAVVQAQPVAKSRNHIQYEELSPPNVMIYTDQQNPKTVDYNANPEHSISVEYNLPHTMSYSSVSYSGIQNKTRQFINDDLIHTRA